MFGDKIIVMHVGRVRTARYAGLSTHNPGEAYFEYRLDPTSLQFDGGMYGGDKMYSNEGITWVKGWTGREVDAFKAMLALRPTT